MVDRGREQNRQPATQGKGVSDLLSHLDIRKPVGPDGICTGLLTKLAGGLTKLLFIIYQQSWLTAELPDNWKLTDVMSIQKKNLKEVLGKLQAFQPVLAPLSTVA